MLQTLAQTVSPTPQGLCQEVPEGNTERPRPSQASSLSHPWAAPFPPVSGKEGYMGEVPPWAAGGGRPGDTLVVTS